MRSSALATLILLLAEGVACARKPVSPIVRAPLALDSPTSSSAQSSGEAATACALPWSLGDFVGGGTVVVVCANDVRREPVLPGPMTRAIEPALEPARRRVCSCAAKMPAPQFIDLKVTTTPDDGIANVEMDAIEEDPEAAPAREFATCIGKVEVSFTPTHSDACGAGRITYVYPFHVDLTK